MKTLKKYLIPNEENEYKPHLLRKTGVAILASLALAIFAFGVFHNFLFIRTSFLSAVLPPVLVDLANEDRLNNQLAVLTINPLLEKAAQEKANDMAAKSYFAHNSPDGKTPWYWFASVGYKYSSAGENLAINFSDSKEVNQAWMNSPGHRANILSGKFTEVGIATAPGVFNGQPTVYIVQMFGKPAQTSPVKKAAPKAVVQNTATNQSVRATTTASTSPLKNQNSNTTVNSVLGESEVESATTEPVVAQTEMFISIENTDEPEITNENPGEHVQNSTLKDRLLTSPKGITVLLFQILSVLVLLALILLIFIETKKQHPKVIFVGFGLFFFILGLFYLVLNIFGTVVVV